MVRPLMKNKAFGAFLVFTGAAAFALIVKGLCLLLGALGFANMWVAIVADVGVMILAVLNAIRGLFVKNL